MIFSIRRPGLVLPAVLIALGTGTALASPAQALTSWSPPVQLPGACGADQFFPSALVQTWRGGVRPEFC